MHLGEWGDPLSHYVRAGHGGMMSKAEIIKRVLAVMEEYAADKELEIYNVEYKKEGPDWKLRVILDKPEDAASEFVNIEECEEATRYLDVYLDENDLIDKSYVLEVCSPGLDRELIKNSDFERFAGRIVEIKFYEPFNGQKQIEAVLSGIDKEGNVIFELEDIEYTVSKKKISKINLAVIF